MSFYGRIFMCGFIIGVGNGILWSDFDENVLVRGWKKQLIKTSTDVFVKSGFGLGLMVTGIAFYMETLDNRLTKKSSLDILDTY
jgi:hypothetical protein